MKSYTVKLTILALLAVLATAAFAGDGGRGSFQISSPAQVNGTTLPAGDYVAKWTGSGPDVQVAITRNGKTLATASGKLVQLSQKASNDSAELQNRAGGTRELTALQFSGKTYSLELTGNATQAKAADSVK